MQDLIRLDVLIDVVNLKINIIDLPHLKANKKAAGRLTDLVDL